jgi:predicted secreted protein
MLRSNRCVFLSHCLLAQTVRANGLAKYFPAAVKPVVQFCLDNDINMIQMPCPEVLCASGGLGRDPHGKAWYEQNGLRQISAKIAHEQANYARQLIKSGCTILAIIGLEFSPACATTYLNRGPVIYKDKGIFAEELKKAFGEVGLEIPFVGVNQRWLKKLDRDLNELLVGAPVTPNPRPVLGRR